MCALHCAQLLHTILRRTDPIIFQTIITAPMMSIRGKGAIKWVSVILFYITTNFIYFSYQRFIYRFMYRSPVIIANFILCTADLTPLYYYQAIPLKTLSYKKSLTVVFWAKSQKQTHWQYPCPHNFWLENENGNKEWSLRCSKTLQTLIGWSEVEKTSILMSATQTVLTGNVVKITHNVT